MDPKARTRVKALNKEVCPEEASKEEVGRNESFKDGSFSLISGGISEGRLCHNTSQLCQVTTRNLTFHSLVSGRYWLKTTPGK